LAGEGKSSEGLLYGDEVMDESWLPVDWLTKVSGAIGRSIDETEAMIMLWYSQGKPLNQIERELIILANANGKELIFSMAGLN
jgi:hypothetical protein